MELDEQSSTIRISSTLRVCRNTEERDSARYSKRLYTGIMTETKSNRSSSLKCNYRRVGMKLAEALRIVSAAEKSAPEFTISLVTGNTPQPFSHFLTAYL